MKLQACYTVLVETLDNGAGRAHLVGPDGKTAGMYTQKTPDEAVESACTSLDAMGAREAAGAIRRNWKARNAEGVAS
jgi:hypothetical protein